MILPPPGSAQQGTGSPRDCRLTMGSSPAFTHPDREGVRLGWAYGFPRRL